MSLAIEALLQARRKGIELHTIHGESYREKGQRVYEAATDAGLPEGTATILQMLTYGAIRVEGGDSRPVVLDVYDDGRLYAYGSYDIVSVTEWALGAAPAAE